MVADGSSVRAGVLVVKFKIRGLVNVEIFAIIFIPNHVTGFRETILGIEKVTFLVYHVYRRMQ